jgi:hypothetical protein
MTIPGYIPAIGERDLDKIVRSIRNLYENGASNDDIAGVTSGYKLFDVEVFPSSGTWTKQSGVDAVLVGVLGGGGGAGRGDGGSSEASCASAGSGGGFSLKWITEGLGATEAVTVGEGGDGGAAGGAAPTAGSTSSFGSHCSATGGGIGTALVSGTSAIYTQAGAPGVGSGGDINVRGHPGGYGIRLSGTVTIPGIGGHSGLGTGGPTPPTTQNEAGAHGALGAGGNAGVSTTTTDRAGGNGGDGFVIVLSYKL